MLLLITVIVKWDAVNKMIKRERILAALKTKTVLVCGLLFPYLVITIIIISERLCLYESKLGKWIVSDNIITLSIFSIIIGAITIALYFYLKILISPSWKIGYFKALYSIVLWQLKIICGRKGIPYCFFPLSGSFHLF